MNIAATKGEQRRARAASPAGVERRQAERKFNSRRACYNDDASPNGPVSAARRRHQRISTGARNVSASLHLPLDALSFPNVPLCCRADTDRQQIERERPTVGHHQLPRRQVHPRHLSHHECVAPAQRGRVGADADNAPQHAPVSMPE